MPLSSSLSIKLDRKSFSEKEVAVDASTELEVGVVIDNSNYFQIFQGVCIQNATTTSQTMVAGIKIFQPSRMIWS